LLLALGVLATALSTMRLVVVAALAASKVVRRRYLPRRIVLLLGAAALHRLTGPIPQLLDLLTP
jgi:hypothetical protein